MGGQEGCEAMKVTQAPRYYGSCYMHTGSRSAIMHNHCIIPMDWRLCLTPYVLPRQVWYDIPTLKFAYMQSSVLASEKSNKKSRHLCSLCRNQHCPIYSFPKVSFPKAHLSILCTNAAELPILLSEFINQTPKSVGGMISYTNDVPWELCSPVKFYVCNGLWVYSPVSDSRFYIAKRTQYSEHYITSRMFMYPDIFVTPPLPVKHNSMECYTTFDIVVLFVDWPNSD